MAKKKKRMLVKSITVDNVEGYQRTEFNCGCSVLFPLYANPDGNLDYSETEFCEHHASGDYTNSINEMTKCCDDFFVIGQININGLTNLLNIKKGGEDAS